MREAKPSTWNGGGAHRDRRVAFKKHLLLVKTRPVECHDMKTASTVIAAIKIRDLGILGDVHGHVAGLRPNIDYKHTVYEDELWHRITFF